MLSGYCYCLMIVEYPFDLTEKVYRDPSDPTQNFLLGVGKDGDNLISLLDLNEVVAERN